MEIFSSKKTSKDLAIIMPAYNEEEAISAVIEEWSEVARRCNGALVLINDGSKDNTLAILKDSMNKYPNLVIINKPNSGHASSCLAGYQWAKDNDFNWIFQTDSDGQTNGNEFLSVWAERINYDFVFGFRSRRGDGFGRWIISKVLRLVILFVFAVSVKDANVPFRLMRVERLAPFLQEVDSSIFLGNAFLAVLIQKYSKVKWVEISFLPRQGGVPSVHWKHFFIVGLRVIREFWEARRNI